MCSLNPYPQVVAMGDHPELVCGLRPVHGASTAGCAGSSHQRSSFTPKTISQKNRCCRSERSIEEQTVSEWRVQESQPAQFSKHRQDAQNAWQTAAAYAPGCCCS